MTTVAGIHAVREALKAAPKRVQKVVLAEGRLDARAKEIAELARRSGVPLFRDKPRALDRLAPGLHHQGVVAEIAPFAWLDLPDLLARVKQPALLVALDQVEDPRNFGAVARSVDAVGGDGIVVHERGQAPPSAVAVAASSGALFHVPCARVPNLTDGVNLLKQNSIWVIGLDPQATMPWFAFDFTGSVALVVGSEGRGLRPRVAKACDALVALPQRGHVSSVNVSVAVGVVLYEALRQRSGARSRI